MNETEKIERLQKLSEIRNNRILSEASKTISLCYQEFNLSLEGSRPLALHGADLAKAISNVISVPDFLDADLTEQATKVLDLLNAQDGSAGTFEQCSAVVNKIYHLMDKKRIFFVNLPT